MPEQGAADSTRGQHKEGARHEGATVRTSVLKKAAQTALAGGMGTQMMAKVLRLLPPSASSRPVRLRTGSGPPVRAR